MRDPATGKFLKGYSGNPNGSKIIVPEDVRKAALELTVEALHRLAHWMRHGDSQASIMAAKIILDRGLGKAIQPVIGSGLVNINVGSGASIDMLDPMQVYREVIGNPDFDMSQLKIAAPAPAQAVERPALPIANDPLAPVPSSVVATMAKCAD